jgi:two-component sensor histidine kinase
MKRYIIGTLILLIFLTSAVLTLFFFLHTRSAFDQIINRQLADIEQQITNRLTGFDILLRPFEMRAAEYNEHINQEVFRKVDEITGGRPRTVTNGQLRRAVEEYSGVHAYLINKVGVVEKSSFEPDIGLDLSALELEFSRFLQSIYGSGKVSTQRLSLSNMTGSKMVYSYFSPEGSDWILETSVDFERFIKERYSDRLYRYLFEEYFTRIQGEHNALVDFDIFQQTTISTRSLLTGEIIPFEEETAQALEEKGEVQHRDETITVYRQFALEDFQYDFVQDSVAMFEYDLSYFHDFLSRWYVLAGGSAAGLILLFSLVIYAVVDRKFVRRIGQLEEVLSYAAEGDYGQRVTYSSSIREMASLAMSTNRLIDTIQSREAELRKNLSERESLLNEIHHRVKNNLNVVISLINLQAQKISTLEEAQEAFVNTHSRIYTMALTHEMLYQSERLSEIDMRGYIETFLARFHQYQENWQKHIEIETEIDDVLLDISYAVPCGIIINELLSNSFKHAFPGEEGGTIKLEFRTTGENELMLSIEDNGVGMPQGTIEGGESSLGLLLVHTLSEQIGGSLQFSGTSGLHCTIRFSPAPHEAQVSTYST